MWKQISAFSYRVLLTGNVSTIFVRDPLNGDYYETWDGDADPVRTYHPHAAVCEHHRQVNDRVRK